MKPHKIPSYVSYSNGQSVPNYYKSVTNFMNIQCALYANHSYVSYYTNKRYETLTYAQVDRLATNIACQLVNATKDVETISFIGDHSADYLITMLAILKLRIPMLAISPRTSEAGVVNLLKKTCATLLIVTSNYEAMANCLSMQCSNLKTIVLQPLNIHRLLKKPIDANHVRLLDYEFSDDDITKTALIFHTSGSVSLPKPNFLSNMYLFNMMSPFHRLITAEKGLRDLDENDTFLACTPLYHIFGFFPIFGASFVGGKAVFMEKLQSSQEEIHFALESNKCTIMSAPPIIYEQMIDHLKKIKDFSTVNRLLVAAFGGAPLKYESGEWLQRHGVNVRDMYGTTESGGSMSSNLDPSCKNWGSVAPFLKDGDGKYYHVFETEDELEPDIKHLYIRGDSPNLATGIANRADGGYDTNDLFRENTKFPGYYNYVGRRDDMLIMENGEKTDPVPMEATIRQDPIIKQVAVIGHGRQCTAALIEIDMDYAKRVSPEEIIMTVHLAIKRANEECFNKHSVILPQMVKILPFEKTLPFTDKGTVIRKKAELEYIDIVEKLYKDFLQGPSRDFDKSKETVNWTSDQVESFIISCAVKVLDVDSSTFLDRSQSFFYYGLDSLTCIQFRNLIAEYFDNVPLNFLYQYTSVESVCKALTNKTEEHSELVERGYQQTQQLAIDYIERSKRDFYVASNTYSDKQDKVIMLTGATGSLGSFILRDLLLDRSVKKVYVMIRDKPGQLMMTRLIQAFESRFLDTSLLKNERVKVLRMQLNEPFLGFSDEKYFELKNEVTIIQHCGWLLDFNMTIDYYDKECIAPFYNLIRFAYRQVNPMHVHFISSVSASAGYGNDTVPEEPLRLDSHVAMPLGYAQSKFVIETLFNYLMTEKKFPCYVERVGQVCGDSENGVWNTSEQYPLMLVGGGSRMRKMPDLDIMVDWIPVDYAAASITDIMLKTAYFSANKDQSVYHIVNPGLVKWRDVLESIKKTGMRFEIVSPLEWLDALAKDGNNPAFKLVGFYQESFFQSLKMPVWETYKTSAVTSMIDKAPVIDFRLFSKSFDRWQSMGFYKPVI
ncbi:hypothetical protein INT48_007434 [Thamnidium elegans]|uniref:Carrier domain-containing protein n=1 Tax=Thamnidium elegans TaxID=101142 RepID=A0A8H7SPU2_9FUNG|nr:hypothetical protein INT48_007434 [Thamnidium elegans]